MHTRLKGHLLPPNGRGRQCTDMYPPFLQARGSLHWSATGGAFGGAVTGALVGGIGAVPGAGIGFIGGFIGGGVTGAVTSIMAQALDD